MRKRATRLAEIGNDPRYKKILETNNWDIVSREHMDLLVNNPAAIADVLRNPATDSVRLTYLAEVAGGALAAELVVPALMDLLKHPSPIVRECALYGLWHHANAEMLVTLAPLAKDDPSECIRGIVQDMLDNPPEVD